MEDENRLQGKHPRFHIDEVSKLVIRDPGALFVLRDGRVETLSRLIKSKERKTFL